MAGTKFHEEKQDNMTIERGDIFYVTGDPAKPPVGAEIWPDRPALVVSNNVLNKSSKAIQVVYLSTSDKKRPSPTHVNVTSGTKTAVAMCEQVHTVDASRLTDRVGKALPAEMDDVDGALMFALQINKGKNPQGIFKKYMRLLDQYPQLRQEA